MLELFYLFEKVVYFLHQSEKLLRVLLLARERAYLPRAFFLFAYRRGISMGELRRVALRVYAFAVLINIAVFESYGLVTNPTCRNEARRHFRGLLRGKIHSQETVSSGWVRRKDVKFELR